MIEEEKPQGTEYASRIDLSGLEASVNKIRNEIGKIIVGQEDLIDKLIVALMSDGHVLLEGMPGVAKTLVSKLLARTVDAGFSRIQFTPDLMPSDVIGTLVFQSGNFEFKKGPIFSNIILIDEINRAPAKTQAALFECMEERQVTVDGKTYPLERPFMIVATQNPVDHEGTYRLPEAQLDRFMFKINVMYPGLDQEKEMLLRHHQRGHSTHFHDIRAVLSRQELETYKNTIDKVTVKDDLLHYIAALVLETRNNSSLYIGASPRASIAVLEASKALAAIRGRDFVTPEDIREVAVPVMVHRISLTPEKEMEGRTANEILGQLLSKVEVPR
ncbi:MAG: MoxR family ATPase [Flavobacteriales bacterium]|nr:MoxR family ATPase [Flavobacteriales bacterium]